MPAYKLKITYAKDVTLNQAHIYLTYYPFKEADPLILDNKNHKILKASQRIDLLSIYSFNSDGIWISKKHKLTKYIGDSQRISLWANLSMRLNKQ